MSHPKCFHNGIILIVNAIQMFGNGIFTSYVNNSLHFQTNQNINLLMSKKSCIFACFLFAKNN